MNKKSLFTFIWLCWLIAGIIFLLILWFKHLLNRESEVEKLVNRYWVIQEDYKKYEGIMNDLHNEAEQIRETALNDYWIVFTEAWQTQSVSPQEDTSI